MQRKKRRLNNNSLSQPDLLLAGLGNPGRAYQKTRHNVGFMICDAISKSIDVPFRFGPGNAQILDWFTKAGHVLVVRPLTFMNNSGSAVAAVLASCSLDPARLCVICDDFNLPLGVMRIRPGGGAGGHNGLQSIIDSLKSTHFGRMRIGVGTDEALTDWSDFVLSKFKRRELRIIRGLDEAVQAAVLSIMAVGYESTMSVYNRNYAE